MKLKPLIITIFVIAVLAIVGWKLTRPAPRAKEEGSLAGEKLLQPEVLEKADEIVFQKPSEKETVVLKREKGGDWILPDYHGFRADFGKLKTLTGNLLDASIIRLVTRSTERMSRLELGTNIVTLKSADGNTLWDLEVGKSGSKSGLFVRLDEKEEAYLADLSFYLDTDLKNWPDKKMLTFEQKDVSRLRIEFSGEGELPLDVSRASPESPFEISGPVAGEGLKQNEVNSLLSTLVGVRFNEVRGLEDGDALKARDNSRQVVIGLFNGDSYTLTVGRRPAEIVEIAVEEGEEEEKEEPKPGPVFIFFESSDAEDSLNRIMSEVTLVYSDYTFNQLPENRDKLVEAKEEEKTFILPESG